MNIDVHDTYARTVEGDLLHFDVLVEQGAGKQALRYAEEWLKGIRREANNINQENCRFCHTETATPEIQKDIDVQGFFIIQMEGCPSPIG